MDRDKITTAKIRSAKLGGDKITMITAYDYPFAKIVDRAGVEIILVGDSLGNNVLGYETTIPVTMEEMLHHTKAVSRARPKALLVADMPFMSYQTTVEEALRNAGRFIKEAGAEAVKLEGGSAVREKIKAITGAGIPVMGHVGLTPQSYHALGGYRVQGRNTDDAERVRAEALTVEESGAFSVVLECIPMKLAKAISEELAIPTIGIGAGPHCDGQVLVLHDVLGLGCGPKPRFVKKYADLDSIVYAAIRNYIEDVERGLFPAEEQSFS